MCVCVVTHVWRSEENLQGSVLTFHMWVLGIRPRWSGLVAWAFIPRAVLPALAFIFEVVSYYRALVGLELTV